MHKESLDWQIPRKVRLNWVNLERWTTIFLYTWNLPAILEVMWPHGILFEIWRYLKSVVAVSLHVRELVPSTTVAATAFPAVNDYRVGREQP